MKLRDFGLLTDENLDPDVVAFLRRQGFGMSDVCEDGLAAARTRQVRRLISRRCRLRCRHEAFQERLNG